MRFRIHSHTSTAAPLKFRKGLVISPTLYNWYNYQCKGKRVPSITKSHSAVAAVRMGEELYHLCFIEPYTISPGSDRIRFNVVLRSAPQCLEESLNSQMVLSVSFGRTIGCPVRKFWRKLRALYTELGGLPSVANNPQYRGQAHTYQCGFDAGYNDWKQCNHIRPWG